MTDLYCSLCLMIVFCGIAFCAGVRVASRTSRFQLLTSELIFGGLMLAYMFLLWDRPLLVRLLPFSSTVILGNWLPAIACFFAGVCSQTPGVHFSRRLGLGIVTCGLSLYSLVKPIPGEPPRCTILQPGRVFQFQTTDETCSPAAAASLLRLHGIHASEAEMARLCLTRTGTHWLGVYRGLKLKLQGTPWDVVAEEFCLQPTATPTAVSGDLPAIRYTPTPAVLSLSFSRHRGSSSIATGESAISGFQGIAGHSVVLLETATDGTLNVFDPSPEYGFESWRPEFMAVATRAVALRIVARPDQLPNNDALRLKLRKEYTQQQFTLR